MRIADGPEIARAQQTQVGLLCQIFDVHFGAHALAEEPEKAPVPSTTPSRD
jgi:hypothetical protein